ncbi:PREDICTED: secreted frizzled-related protein 1-like [Propithecus coquereli]|uniref:secreted frizzled-related protein 1-like n=1 Tax=Propithecus coquereli TaxID=379532 RepID=UPI00063F9027|nr:PREDICTED: secreted frizzled-related protein 1-like [Propithecus coquereli]
MLRLRGSPKSGAAASAPRPAPRANSRCGGCGRPRDATGQTRQECAAAERGRAGDGAFCPRKPLEVCGGRADAAGSPDVEEPHRRARPGLLLALAATLLTAGSASEYNYVGFQSGFYAKSPQCMDIPADLRLCHNVGCKRMVPPSLLEHETMAEAKQQASSWVSLLNRNRRMGTQVFLCSLFSPVRLHRPIYPCRWLCEAVSDSWEPVMQFFGFYWPEMLKCDKFPKRDVCITMTAPNATKA